MTDKGLADGIPGIHGHDPGRVLPCLQRCQRKFVEGFHPGRKRSAVKIGQDFFAGDGLSGPVDVNQVMVYEFIVLSGLENSFPSLNSAVDRDGGVLRAWRVSCL